MKHTSKTPIIMMFLAIIAIAIGSQSGTGLVSNTQSLNATLLYYEPIPATPGSVIDVFVQVTNAGTASAKVSVEFVDTFPFSIDTETERIKSTSNIPSQESFLVKYRIRVSPEAQPGPNNIKIIYYTDKANTQSVLLPIDVFSSEVSLAVDKIIVTPNTLTPGEVGTIVIHVRNDARLTITDGYIQLVLANLDIIPYGTTDQQRLSGLGAGATREFEFQIIPSPDLEPGVYQIPTVINYTDQRGTRYSFVQIVGLRISGKPDVSVTLDEITAGTQKDEANLIIRATNKGLGEIKFVTLDFKDASGYTLKGGSKEKYIGNIDSDDYKTARVTVHLTEETVEVPVTITYSDAFNQQTQKEIILSVNNPGNGNEGTPGWLIAVIVIVAILGIWWFLRKRKGRK